ncbi:hypothetical protein GJV03_16635 [Acinetobacter sp. RIT698]|uniref:hypothetical protein n=1 Tax=Acinetobacter sp. RIT698 TaxID=2666192 RepID=UPI0012ACFC37|nr:hypothetical protein [Acinetobacter sp. RIT698]MRT38797.1 hypothetical protein [Acinetobacter sp. RIT698]
MTLKDSVQTAILVVGFFSLLVFGATYYFVLIDPDSSSYPLKESLSITASFFGGFSTLVAAYIATHLYEDWRVSQTAINRAELAKNTQLSLYSLVCLCTFYYKLAFNKKAILNGVDLPGINEDFKNRAKLLPWECHVLKNEFKNEFDVLFKKFELSLLMYERSFDMQFKVDQSHLDNYRFAIGGVLRDLSQSKSKSEINLMAAHMNKMQSEFEEHFVKKITAETSKHININSNDSII